MPNLNEFLNAKIKEESKGYELEHLNGVRGCAKCDENVSGASWDPIELVMSWKCSKEHVTTFKVQ
jgi:hypothetical protein